MIRALSKIIVLFLHHINKKGEIKMNRYKTVAVLTLSAMMLFVGCAVQPQLSPAQKRQITTRLFEAGYENTYRSILTVLQDQGYIIKNTDMNTGLVNATIDREAGTGSQVAQAVLLGYVADKGSEMDASFMVNKINESKTEVRINIQEANYGQSNIYSSASKQSVKQILDPGIYNSLFNEIQTEVKRREAMGN
jgi:hypothetical protein|tara:strand:- start:4 stop:582 length:579 start_codon:yes stop_codon:yes gene_type:complete